MIAEKDKVVVFAYTLKDDDGNVLDTSDGREPLPYLHGARNIIPGLEAALDGKAAGDQVTAVIAPEQAYGMLNEQLIDKIPRENLDGIENLEVGLQLEAQTPDGTRIVRVAEVGEETVTIDANHPLAGMTLHFDVTVTEVRDATADELEHGHVHGDGCNHD